LEHFIEKKITPTKTDILLSFPAGSFKAETLVKCAAFGVQIDRDRNVHILRSMRQ